MKKLLPKQKLTKTDKVRIWWIIIFFISILPYLTSCSTLVIKPKPPCDVSNFDMTTAKGRFAHAWCLIKLDAKKL